MIVTIIKLVSLFLIEGSFGTTILDLTLEQKKDAYEEIISFSKKLIEECPKKDCLIIGVGRSPTPLIDTLDLLKSTSHVQIPLTSFRYNKRPNLRFDALSEEKTTQLYDHFSSFLEEYLERKGLKKVVILDYAATGERAFSSMQYLESFFEKKFRSSPKVKIALIRERGSNNLIDLNAKDFGVSSSKIINLKIKKQILLALFQEGLFDKISRYSSFFINSSVPFHVNDSELRGHFLEELKTFVHPNKKKNCKDLMD